MNPFDINLVWFNPIVHLLEAGLRLLADPLEHVVSPGLAGGLAIIIFTIAIRLLLLPLSLTQVRSQKAQMAIQPELKLLQKKYKGNREELARAQMALYKERGVNPAAGCLPLVVQMPILFAMYSAMLQLSTMGLTLDQVQTRDVGSGRLVYAATREAEPFPRNQFVLTNVTVVPQTDGPITLNVSPDNAAVLLEGTNILEPGGTQPLTLTPGQVPANTNPPSTPTGQASIFLRPGGIANPDGSLDSKATLQVGKPYVVEIMVDASQTRADTARLTLTYDPAQVQIQSVDTPASQDLAFKSRFAWLPSLGEPDVIGHISGFGIPGLLLIVMTITSYVSQRMTTMPTDDPQQQAMMKSMAFMPLMYLFFFLNTPAGLVLYWLTSNIFTMIQQYFATGLGTLGGDLERLTGRNYQPSWAQAGSLNGTSASRNGSTRDDAGDSADETDTTPGQNRQPVDATRRGRAAQAKGRKRGKR